MTPPTDTMDLTQSFFNDTPPMISQLRDEDVGEPVSQMRDGATLIVMDATQGEARKLEKQALAQAGNLFETLREIHERKAWRHLGAKSFDEWYRQFRGKVKHVTDISTFYRQLAHREVVATLSSAGVDTRNLTQQQSERINRLPPGLQPDAYRLAQEKSDAAPPAGPAAEYHHAGKVYLEKLEEAIAEVTGKVLDDVEGGEPDPFEPEPEKDLFAPETRAKLLNDAKPLPPAAAEEKDEEEEEEIVPTRLDYYGITRYTGDGGDFLFVTGWDVVNDSFYEIPLRVDAVKKLL